MWRGGDVERREGGRREEEERGGDVERWEKGWKEYYKLEGCWKDGGEDGRPLICCPSLERH